MRRERQAHAPPGLALLPHSRRRRALETAFTQLLQDDDDPLGVTAAFNRNLLVRINRELQADVDVEAFAHRVRWNANASRVEMHLVSRRPQRVRIARAGVEFSMREGESIWTESSYKYRPADVMVLLERTGFRVAGQWVDRRDGFALTLAEA